MMETEEIVLRPVLGRYRIDGEALRRLRAARVIRMSEFATAVTVPEGEAHAIAYRAKWAKIRVRVEST